MGCELWLNQVHFTQFLRKMKIKNPTTQWCHKSSEGEALCLPALTIVKKTLWIYCTKQWSLLCPIVEVVIGQNSVACSHCRATLANNRTLFELVSSGHFLRQRASSWHCVWLLSCRFKCSKWIWAEGRVTVEDHLKQVYLTKQVNVFFKRNVHIRRVYICALGL